MTEATKKILIPLVEYQKLKLYQQVYEKRDHTVTSSSDAEGSGVLNKHFELNTSLASSNLSTDLSDDSAELTETLREM